MSNLEEHPVEVVAGTSSMAVDERRVQVLAPREVPLGGPRAMTVHRTLPQRG